MSVGKQKKNPSEKSSGNKASKVDQILRGTKCLVEARNEDGTDASKSFIASIRTMGGETMWSLSEEVTHYICSNVHPERQLAAQLLNIHVVSPLWVQQCYDTLERVSEDDFRHSDGLRQQVKEWIGEGRYVLPPSLLFPPTRRLSEPIPGKALMGRSLDSPHFSSSQRPFREEAEEERPRAGRKVLPSLPSLPPSPPSLLPTKPSSDSSLPLASSSSIPAYFKDAPSVAICRYHKLPLSLRNANSLNLSVRRSERIMDLSGGESSDDDVYSDGEPVYEQFPRMKEVSLIVGKEHAAQDDERVRELFPSFFKNPKAPLIVNYEQSDDEEGNGKKIKEMLTCPLSPRLLPSHIPELKDTEVKRIMVQKQKANKTIEKNEKNTSAKKNVIATPLSPSPLHPSPSPSPKRGRKKSAPLSAPPAPILSLPLQSPQSPNTVAKKPKQSNKQRGAGEEKRKVVLAICVPDLGEYKTLKQIVKSIIKATNTHGHKSSVSSLADASEFKGNAKVEILPFEEASEGEGYFTHVILPEKSNSRSSLVIVAMARGLPILSDEFLYSSLDDWRNPSEFRHPRYASLPLQPSTIFKKKSLRILFNSTPSTYFVESVVKQCGGRVMEELEGKEEVDFVVLGGKEGDLKHWIGEQSKRGGWEEMERLLHLIMVEKKPLVTPKYIFNCIERQEILPPSRGEKEAEVYPFLSFAHDLLRNALRERSKLNKGESKKGKKEGEGRGGKRKAREEGESEEEGEEERSERGERSTKRPRGGNNNHNGSADSIKEKRNLLVHLSTPSPVPAKSKANDEEVMGEEKEGEREGEGEVQAALPSSGNPLTIIKDFVVQRVVQGLSNMSNMFSPNSTPPPPALPKGVQVSSITSGRQKGKRVGETGAVEGESSTQQAASSLIFLSSGGKRKREEVRGTMEEIEEIEDSQEYDRLVSHPSQVAKKASYDKENSLNKFSRLKKGGRRVSKA